jgi:REP element-mobilizing transposase RayT
MTANSKYIRRSIRLKGYDYSQPDAYFITICTFQKICLFGDIVAGEVHLNPFGIIASWELARLPQRFPYMIIDEAIIITNHIHAIWIIREERDTTEREIDSDPSSIRRAPTPEARRGLYYRIG